MALRLRGLPQVIPAALDVITVAIECVDRAAMQARFGLTAETGRIRW